MICRRLSYLIMTILQLLIFSVMKRMILKNWMLAALLAGACCGFVACNDDDDNGGQIPSPTPDTETVIGEYTGTMQIVEKQP